MNRQPTFVPGTMFIESPPSSTKFGIYWEACDWFHEDYLPFMILQRVIGDYEKQFNFETDGDENFSLTD